MTNTTIKVLVVDDSLTVRKRLVEVLDAASDIEVVGEAGNGQEAIDLCERLRPDVITMDMVLPIKSGLAATEHIMGYCPTPILVVSASTNRRDLYKTYDALRAGALAVFEKPSAATPASEWQDALVRRVRMLAGIAVVTHPRGRLASQPSPPISADDDLRPRVVAIGASTGGPRAVLTILDALPANYPIPIVLVVHIGEVLGQGLPAWLDSQVDLPVCFADDGHRLPAPGQPGVFMAPPDHHLIVEHDTLRLNRDAQRHHCRPAVDPLFESVAHAYGKRGVGCLLTGMGRDGADGLAAIQDAGGITFAQDEATSVVFGMPGEAIRRGAAQRVLGLNDIAPALVDLAKISTQIRGDRT